MTAHSTRTSAARDVAVSVVVPMYQSAATVQQTVHSALSDLDISGISGEVVVVNDGSTDEGPRIVQAMIAADSRVRLLHKPNGGLSSARNFGLAGSRGRWLRFLDADDLAVPGGLTRLVKCAEMTGAACGGQSLIADGGAPMGREISARSGPDGTVGTEQLRGGNAMGVGTVLLKRELLTEQRFDESLPVCEDWDLWLRMAQRGVRFTALPGWNGPVKRYRVRAGSLSKKFRLMHDVGVRVLRAARDRGADVEAGILGLALGYGAMQAIAGDVEGGMQMLAGHQPRRLSAEAPGADAFAAVLLGRGCAPEARGAERQSWAAAVADWWEELRIAGWTDAEATSGAWDELAARTLSPRDIAKACVAEADSERLVVVGMGKNGRAVLEAAQGSGCVATARDDAVDREHAQELPTAWEPMDAPIPREARVIITPQHDEALIERLVACCGLDRARIVRWSQTLAALVGPESGDLRQASREGRVGNMPSLRCA